MDCEKYQPFMDYWPLHIVLILQALCGLLSAVFSVYTLTQCRNLYFHVNCRTLIHGQLVIFVIHSVFIVAIQKQDGRFMMVLERIIATFRKNRYERAGQRIGVCLLLVGVALSATLTLWTIQEENFSSSYPYCSSGSAITIARLSVVHYALCAICAASLFGILGLRVYNKFALDRKTFSLGDSFHLRENQHIIQLLYPLAIFQAIFLLFFVAGGAVVAAFRHTMELIIFRTIFAAFYFIPYYTAITPILILLIIQKAKRSSDRRLETMRNVTNAKEIFRTGGLCAFVSRPAGVASEPQLTPIIRIQHLKPKCLLVTGGPASLDQN
ncbi:integral membrane protein, C.elegans Sra family [Ancylostoma ceylanicum]|uniref:Integral membrane protein, C.elegans Sra family n=1 Tax=Ancylostoma ceylanicum TaxID=53326 RepID=A0A0D6LM90_9BILA|nr:integral membrane protein, C.elegans Sra family [Ancylostoma ceylanicum]